MSNPSPSANPTLYFNLLPPDVFRLVAGLNRGVNPEHPEIPGINAFGPQVIMQTYNDFESMQSEMADLERTSYTIELARPSQNALIEDIPYDPMAIHEIHAELKSLNLASARNKAQFEKVKERFDHFYPPEIMNALANPENQFKLIQAMVGGAIRYSQYPVLNPEKQGLIPQIDKKAMISSIMTGLFRNQPFVVIKASKYLGTLKIPGEFLQKICKPESPFSCWLSTGELFGDLELVSVDGKSFSDIIRKIHELVTTGTTTIFNNAHAVTLKLEG